MIRWTNIENRGSYRIYIEEVLTVYWDLARSYRVNGVGRFRGK